MHTHRITFNLNGGVVWLDVTPHYEPSAHAPLGPTIPAELLLDIEPGKVLAIELTVTEDPTL